MVESQVHKIIEAAEIAISSLLGSDVIVNYQLALQPNNYLKVIVEAVFEFFSLDIDLLKSKMRTKEVSRARTLCVVLIKKAMPDITHTKLGQIISRDYTSVIHALSVHQDDMATNKNYRNLFDILTVYVQKSLNEKV